MSSRVFTGTGISPGAAIGRAVVLESGRQLVFKRQVSKTAIKREIERLARAIEHSERQLLAVKQGLMAKIGREHAYILDAHIMMLKDKSFFSRITEVIANKGVNAEWAVKEVTDWFVEAYASLKEDYFRERGREIEDLAARVLMNLMGKPRQAPQLPPNSIIVARSLTPSLIAGLDCEKLKGFAVEEGGATSHTAIIIRSLGMPAVINLPGIFGALAASETLIVDGSAGLVIASPEREELLAYRRRLVPSVVASSDPGAGAYTRDGHKITIQANIEFLRDVKPALARGSEGVGLFRSEFLLFRSRNGFPSEGAQFRAYRRLAELAAPYPATIRTFDVGADKLAERWGPSREINPALGLRGIRFSLQARQLFEAQVRAILRASAFGRLEIALPLVSRLEELREAKKIIASLKESLRRREPNLDADLKIGVMIETPSAVVLADCLAEEADFLCIGTNDLTQYTLAVDRASQSVSHLFHPLHPAILRSIQTVVRAAENTGKPVRVCGEAAANPLYALVLLGMGIKAFSLNVNSLLMLKRIIRAVSVKEAGPLAEKACSFTTVAEVESFLGEKLSDFLRRA